MSEQLYVPVDQIHSTSNVRLDEALDDGFVDSIKTHGVLTPVLLERNDAGFNLISGHRRVAAARKIGLTQVPALLTEAGAGSDRIVLQLVENIQRRELDPIEEALAYQNLANEGVQQKDIATMVGVTQPHISRRISLLKLSDAIQNKVRNGSVDVNTAVDLAKIRDHTVQDALVKDGCREHQVNMALKRQAAEDELEKFIKKATNKVEFSDRPDLMDYVVFGRYYTLADYQKAALPEDQITVAGHDYDMKPCFIVYVPKGGTKVVDPEEQARKDAAKIEREANRERQSHLKTIVAKATAKDVMTMAASLLFDRLVTANTAGKISKLLDLNPEVGGYQTKQKKVDPTTGEISGEVVVTDYTKLVTDWYSQSPKGAVQALMAAIVVNYDGTDLVEEYLKEKGVPTVAELIESATD